MGKLLFDSEPLLIPRELAVKIGLNESIVLQQIHYWIEINRKARINNYDSYTWTYNTIAKWKEQFPFWSEKTISRTLSSLKKQGLIITGNYNQKGYDKTLWYAINYDTIESLEKEDLKPHENSYRQNVHSDKYSCGQNDRMEQDKMTVSNKTKCPNGIGQSDHVDKDKVTEPIPKINTKTNTKITEESGSFFPLSPPIDNFFNSIKAEMSEVSFKTWIEPLEIKEDKNKIIIAISSDLTKTMIKNKFIKLIEIHLKKYFEFDSIEVVSADKLQANA